MGPHRHGSDRSQVPTPNAERFHQGGWPPDGRIAVPLPMLDSVGRLRRSGVSRTMSRFVLLEHDHPELHWDLMLESGAVLRTWRLTAPPCGGEVITAMASFDHRALYLDYEGPIS